MRYGGLGMGGAQASAESSSEGCVEGWVDGRHIEKGERETGEVNGRDAVAPLPARSAWGMGAALSRA